MKMPWAALPALLILFSPSLFARRISDRLWDEGVERAKAFGGIHILGAFFSRRTPDDASKVDAAPLEKKLAEARKSVQELQSQPPDLGAFFGEGPHANVIISLLIGGPLDRAGVNPGDKITAVNGRPVASYAQIKGLLGQGRALLTVAGRGEPVSVQEERPHLFSADAVQSLANELRIIENALKNLEREQEGLPGSRDAEDLRAQARRISERLDILKEKISGLWTAAAKKNYRGG